MPSPFPGMNPYLESDAIWHDCHERIVPIFSDLLVPQVRPNYMVRLDRNVYIHEPSAQERRLIGRGDLNLARADVPGSPQATAGLLEAPATCRLPSVEVYHEVYLEIRERETRELVTVVELLSPTNKRNGEDREQYLLKRSQLLRGDAHFVEIDLLRGGPRMPARDLPDCDYYGLVSRAERRPVAGVWPVRVRHRLPIIPIPLRAPHDDALLDLQEALHTVYDRAGYEDHIYRLAVQPPLHPEDAAWAAQFVPKPATS